MKEATGELSMTVIVIIGAIAIVGIVSFLIPEIKKYVNNSWTTITQSCPEGQSWSAGANDGRGGCV